MSPKPDPSIPASQPFDPNNAANVGDDSPGMSDQDRDDFFGDIRKADNRDIARESVGRQLAATLSGARSLNPMLEAVVFFPGVDANPDDMQQAVEDMLHATATITDHAMSTLSIPDDASHAWAKSMLHQVAVAGVAEQWKVHGHANPEAWTTIVGSVVAAGVTEHKRDYPDVDDQTAFTMSHFSALSDIAREVRHFSFFYDHAQLLERLSKYLDRTVAEATDTVLEGINARPADRLMTEQGLLKHAGRLFSEVYRAEARRTFDQVSGMSPEQRQDFVANNRHKEAIGRVTETFGSLYTMLVNTSRLRSNERPSRSASTQPQPEMS
jgi:hypothetical protein